jgi:hypothetical protein
MVSFKDNSLAKRFLKLYRLKGCLPQTSRTMGGQNNASSPSFESEGKDNKLQIFTTRHHFLSLTIAFTAFHIKLSWPGHYAIASLGHIGLVDLRMTK